MTIGQRLLGGGLLLLAIAFVQVAAVVQLRDAQRDVDAELDRLSNVMNANGMVWQQIDNIATNRAAFYLSGDESYLAAVAAAGSAYDDARRGLAAFMVEPAELGYVTTLHRAYREWQAAWGTLRPEQFPDVGLAEAHASAYGEIQGLLDGFLTRQQGAFRARLEAGEARIEQLAQRLIVLSVTSAVALIVVLVGVRGAIVAPLRSLASAARRIAGGEQVALGAVDRRDELGDCARAMNRMVLDLRGRESDLQEAAERLQAIIDIAPVGIVIVERQSRRIQAQNPRAIALLTHGDTLGERQRVVSLRDVDGRLVSTSEWPVERALTGVSVEPEEFQLEKEGVPPKHLLIGAVPLMKAGTVTAAVVVVQDLAPIREADRMREDFVATLGHDLSAPLTSIRRVLQLVLEDVSSLNEGYRELLQGGLREVVQLSRVVNDVIDLSQLESGRVALERTTASLRDVASVACAEFAEAASKKRIKLDVCLPDVLPAVEIDSDRMAQVLSRLLANAIAVAPEGTTVRVSAASSGSQVTVLVADQGPRVRAEERELLFRKFGQGGAMSKRGGGHGLGLAVARAVVEQHGGRLDVESEAGEGTTFAVSMPVTAPSGGADAQAAAQTRVLVIDDDRGFRQLLRTYLERAGFWVSEAADGASGLAAARALRPSLMLVDLIMDRMDGWEFAVHVREDRYLRSVPLVFVTALDDAHERLPANAIVLPKTMAPKDIVSRVSRLVPIRNRDGARAPSTTAPA